MPPVSYCAKNPARLVSQSRSGGKGATGVGPSRGDGGHGRGFGAWMLPDAPDSMDGVDGVDGLLAVVADHSLDDSQGAAGLMVGGSNAPAAPAASTGALCMLYPGPGDQTAADMSSSGSSVSSSG